MRKNPNMLAMNNMSKRKISICSGLGAEVKNQLNILCIAPIKSAHTNPFLFCQILVRENDFF